MSVGEQGLILLLNPLCDCSYLKPASHPGGSRKIGALEKRHQAGRSWFFRTWKPEPQKPVEVSPRMSPPPLLSTVGSPASVVSSPDPSALPASLQATKGGSLRHPGSGEYFQRVAALSSSLAMSDHNKLCTSSVRLWHPALEEQQGWLEIHYLKFLFLFLTRFHAAPLLSSPSFSPRNPLFWGVCIWQFFSNAAFVPFCYLVPAFPGLPLPPWSCVFQPPFPSLSGVCLTFLSLSQPYCLT